jgi:tRNA (guanine37-N1)-methyltransferase
MWFGIISIFPEIFNALNSGVTGRALKEQLLTLQYWNPRDFATNKHQSVDDAPYGGGPGMVMRADVLSAAICAAKAAAPQPTTPVIYLSPQGKRFDQAAAAHLAAQKSVILLAGRYEGIDERIITTMVDEEWSIGDYILTGGELAAMVMIDVTARLLPGTVGDQASVAQDSLTSGLLKYPQYTRPEQFQGLAVPAVLLSGNHQQIARWRLEQSLNQTWLKRPDLLEKRALSEEEARLLKELIESKIILEN